MYIIYLYFSCHRLCENGKAEHLHLGHAKLQTPKSGCDSKGAPTADYKAPKHPYLKKILRCILKQSEDVGSLFLSSSTGSMQFIL